MPRQEWGGIEPLGKIFLLTFPFYRTGPTVVTIGTTAAMFSPVGGDTTYDAIGNIFAGAVCDGVKLGILPTDNSCVFPVRFNVLDHDPGDIQNKKDDIGKWFVDVTVPYTGAWTLAQQ